MARFVFIVAAAALVALSDSLTVATTPQTEVMYVPQYPPPTAGGTVIVYQPMPMPVPAGSVPVTNRERLTQGGSGWSFIGFVLVVFAVYMIAGCWYNATTDGLVRRLSALSCILS